MTTAHHNSYLAENRAKGDIKNGRFFIIRNFMCFAVRENQCYNFCYFIIYGPGFSDAFYFMLAGLKCEYGSYQWPPFVFEPLSNIR